MLYSIHNPITKVNMVARKKPLTRPPKTVTSLVGDKWGFQEQNKGIGRLFIIPYGYIPVKTTGKVQTSLQSAYMLNSTDRGCIFLFPNSL